MSSVSAKTPSQLIVEWLHAGVYVGCMYQEYIDVQVGVSARLAPQAVAGSGLSFMVGRLSYTFNFSGPCVSTDTACSSSLVAAHLACKVSSLLTQGWTATEKGICLAASNSEKMRDHKMPASLLWAAETCSWPATCTVAYGVHMTDAWKIFC